MSIKNPMSTWLVSLQLDQENPIVQINDEDNSVSYAAFPENPQSFAIFEGYLFDKYNFQMPQSASDADRIIKYYKIFGDDLFTKLRGAYSLVVWDAAERCLIAGRDHMGHIPLYFLRTRNRITMSSSMSNLTSYLEISNIVNKLMMAEYLLGFLPNHHLWETFFEDISRLPPAHFIRISNQYYSTARYWNPLPKEFQWVEENDISEFFYLFQQAVQRCLDAGADSIALSGGLDSSSIAVMASRIQESTGLPPLHAISQKNPGTGADNGPIQKAVAKALGMPITLLTTEELISGGSVITSSLDLSSNLPLPSQNLMEGAFSSLVRISHANGYTNLMIGIGGDEMLIPEPRWVRDLFHQLKLKQIFQVFLTQTIYKTDLNFYKTIRKAIMHTIRFLAQSTLQSVGVNNGNTRNSPFRFPDWMIKTNKDFIQAIEQRRHETIQANDYKNDGYYLSDTRKLLQEPNELNYLEHRYFISRHDGVNFMYPFHDPDLINFAFRIPPIKKINNFWMKSPLQQFLIENKIPINLPAKKTKYGPTYNNLLRTEGRNVWKAYGKLRELEELQIIEKTTLIDYVENYFNSYHNDWLLPWKIISIESWIANNHN